MNSFVKNQGCQYSALSPTGILESRREQRIMRIVGTGDRHRQKKRVEVLDSQIPIGTILLSHSGIVNVRVGFRAGWL